MLSRPDRVLAFTHRGWGIGMRMAAVGGILLSDKAFLNLFVDFDSAQRAEGVGAVVREMQHWGFRFLVSFVIAAIVFGYLRHGRELQLVDADARAAPPVRPLWLLVHLAVVALLVPLSASLYGTALPVPLLIVVVLWVLVATLAAGALFAALGPWVIWRDAISALREVCWYAAIAAAGAASAMGWSQRLWGLTARVTFESVHRLLGWLLPNLQVDPVNLTIDTGRFAVAIDPVCSGLEGMGLMLAFCVVLLLLFHREYVFPRALLLVPAGLLLSFVLNIGRIATLVMVGDAGYTNVAIYGFHSQAGWLLFNGAAVGIAVMSLRSRWFSRLAPEHAEVYFSDNQTALYLLPFLAIVLGGMLSHAASGGFEAFYWLRLLLGAVALGYFWPRLKELDWHFSGWGVLAGVGIFAAWIVAARLLLSSQEMPATLSALPALPRNAWIIGHIVASVGVAPVAEELAFRGYLMRRLVAVEFETVSPRAAGWPALAVSSVVFGLCHGQLWPAGIVAGLVFGLLYATTGRLGEAVIAHVVANALIAVAVLVGSQWQLW